MAIRGLPALIALSMLTPVTGQLIQQEPALVGARELGRSVAFSADGNTAIVGDELFNDEAGAVWVYTRRDGVWGQGQKVLGAGATGRARQGSVVAISADGNTALLGGAYDNSNTGAVWIFTRSNGVWTQQGPKLVGPGASGLSRQGLSVGLSADGNTAIVGGFDSVGTGAAWVYRRSNGVWTQLGQMLEASGASGPAWQRYSVALSADGKTAILGVCFDANGGGTAWVYTLSSGTWTEGQKLVFAGVRGQTYHGSVALSTDGNMAIVGATGDSNLTSATWLFKRANGLSSPQWQALTRTGAVGHSAEGGQLQPEIVFTTYGPGNSYCTNCSLWDTGFHDFPTDHEQPYHRGMPFTVNPSGSFRLDSLVITIFPVPSVQNQAPPTGQFLLSVNADAGGLPGPLLETIAVELAGSTYYSPATYTAPSLSLPTLNAGQRYWLTTDVSDPSVMDVEWVMNSQGITGPVAWHAGDTPWTISHPNGTLAAFIVAGTRISTPPVPVVNLLSPSQVFAGSGSFTLNVFGNNLTASNVIQWNGASLSPTTAAGTTQLSAAVPANLISTAGTATVTATGATGSIKFTIIQPPCFYSLAPTFANVQAGASSGSIAVTANCSYSTVNNNPDLITITSGASGPGSSSVGYGVAPNSGPLRTGTISVLDQGGNEVARFTVIQAASPCTNLTFLPISANFDAGGGAGTVAFSASPCAWTAVSSDPSFVILSASSGSSPGFTFNVTPNKGSAARSATITINSSRTLTITQAAMVCTYTIATSQSQNTLTNQSSNLSQGFLAAGGPGSIVVTTSPGCQWTAGSNSPFITLGPNGGTGTGTLGYSITANNSPAPRVGTLTVAGFAYFITQAAAGQSYAASASSASSTSIIRAEGISELVGDLIVNTSGTTVTGGVVGDVIVSYNTPITNHLLSIDTTGQTTDALLLMNDPFAPVLGSNVFRGQVYGPNAIRFANVQLAPANGGSFTGKLRITSVRVNASVLPMSGTVTAFVNIVAPVQFTIANAQQTLAVLQSGSSFHPATPSPGSPGQTIQPVTFTEGFAGAFRPKLASGQDPSSIDTRYNSESGFVNTAAFGPETGIASTGTRLSIFIDNIPSGVTVYAPVSQSLGTSGALAKLVSAGPNGAGGAFLPGSTVIGGVNYEPVPLNANGSGTATWEVTASSLNLVETLTFNLLINNPAGVALNPVLNGFLSAELAASAPSFTAPVPRFLPQGTGGGPTLQKVSLSIVPSQASQAAQAPAHLSSVSKEIHTLSVSGRAAAGTHDAGVVGGTVIQTSVLTNTSNQSATNVVVGGSLPSTAQITSCDAGSGGGICTYNDNTLNAVYPTFGPGQTATINVTARVTAGLGSYSSGVVSDSPNINFSTSAFSAIYPGFTTPVAPADGSTIPAGVPLSWNATDGAFNYRVYFGSTNPPPLVGGITQSTSYDPGPLTPGTYYWQILALTGGIGTGSPVFSFTVAPCAYQINPSNVPLGVAGGTGTIAITTTPSTGCTWNFSNISSGLTIAPLSGNGSGTATYTVAANQTSQARHLTATIQTKTFAVDQSSSLPAFSVSPSSGAGSSQVFTFTFPSANGYQDLAGAQIVINSALTAVNSCYILFARPDIISLAGDSAVSFQSTSLGAPAVLQNSQCGVLASLTSQSGSGNSVILSLSVVFKTSGAKTVWANYNNNAGVAVGYQALGTYTSTAIASGFSSSVIPSSGSGQARAFTFTYIDPKGAPDISGAQIAFNSALSGVNACYILFSANNIVSLASNDANTFTTAVLGKQTVLQNSQCSVYPGLSYQTQSGQTLSFTVFVAFNPAFAGTKNIYSSVNDNAGTSSGFSTLGTWTVAASAPLSVNSVSPAAASGPSQALTFVYAAPAGYADIVSSQVIVNPTASAVNSCAIQFNRAAGSISLSSDSGSGSTTATLGLATTLQNSQCIVNAAASSQFGAGNYLTLTLFVTMKTSGAQNIYAAVTGTSTSVALSQAGSWAVISPATMTPISVTPATSAAPAGTFQPFTFTLSNPAGANDISGALIVFYPSLQGYGACYILWGHEKNQISLASDDANSFGTGTAGSPGLLQNSQCTIDPANSFSVQSGNTVNLTVSVTFKPAFQQFAQLYSWVNVQDSAHALSGWFLESRFTVQ